MTITKTVRQMAFFGLMALVAAILPLTAASAQDATGVDFDINADFEASDALQTSILLSQAAFPDGADTVLLTTSEDGADALSSGVLANDAALLYYSTDEGVVQAHVDEIERLGATNVIIIGGEARIGADVETALEDMGLTVTRLAGPDRISTSNEVLAYAAENRDDFNATAKHISRAFGTEDNSETAFADAVGLGAWDAQGGAGSVLAPSDASVLSETYPTVTYFTETNPGNERIVPIGGEAAVPTDVLDYLAGEPANQEVADRVAGENRAGTAVAINNARGLDPAALDGVVFVDAFAAGFFIDAYAVSALAGNNGYAVLTTNGDALTPETEAYLGAAAFAQDEMDCGDNVFATPNVTAIDAIESTCGVTLEPTMLMGETEVSGNTGIVIDDTAAPDYTYQPADGSDPVDVTVGDDDTFTVDGAPATVDAFTAALSNGDTITVTVTDDGGTPDDDTDDVQNHDLVNVEAAETGTIGNVNTATGVFDIIEPISGVTISAAPIDYGADCDLYNLNGGVVIGAQFEAALNEGDVFDTSEDAAGNVTCMLTDATVAGTVTVGDTPGAEYFMIGNLGDDFASTNNDTFVASMAKFDAGDLVINVDGEPITDYDDFADVLSDGDQAEYSRTNDTETVSLTNGLPTTISGQAIEGLAANTFDIATNPGVETVTYAGEPDTRFIVDGLVATEADFLADYSAGDATSYTPEDVAGGTPETVTLSNQDLSGPVDDATISTGGPTTYDVLSSAEDATLATVDYTAGAIDDRYVVDGEEVDLAEFEAALDSITDGDNSGVITVTESALATTHSLVLTEI